MIQFAPQLILIAFTVVRLTVSLLKISYDRQKDASDKVGHVIGTFLYYFICHWVLWAGGFYHVFER